MRRHLEPPSACEVYGLTPNSSKNRILPIICGASFNRVIQFIGRYFPACAQNNLEVVELCIGPLGLLQLIKVGQHSEDSDIGSIEYMLGISKNWNSECNYYANACVSSTKNHIVPYYALIYDTEGIFCESCISRLITLYERKLLSPTLSPSYWTLG